MVLCPSSLSSPIAKLMVHPNKHSEDLKPSRNSGFSRGSPSYYRELNHIYAWTVKDTFLKKTPVFVGASIFFQTLQEDLRCLVLLFTLNKNRKCKEEALELKTDRGNMETLQTSRDNCNQISRATGALIGQLQQRTLSNLAQALLPSAKPYKLRYH